MLWLYNQIDNYLRMAQLKSTQHLSIDPIYPLSTTQSSKYKQSQQAMEEEMGYDSSTGNSAIPRERIQSLTTIAIAIVHLQLLVLFTIIMLLQLIQLHVLSKLRRNNKVSRFHSITPFFFSWKGSHMHNRDNSTCIWPPLKHCILEF